MIIKSRSQKTSLGILLGIVLLNSIGLSIVLPLLPFIVSEYLPDDQVVLGMSALLSVFAACTFIAAPILGALSDRYGRKIIFIICLFGSVIGYILFGIGGALWILFIGRIIDGISAGNISTVFAYISDITNSSERTVWFGYVGSVMGIGKLIGPALGGLLGSYSLALPFYITAGLVAFSGFAVYFFLPESLNNKKRTTQVSLLHLNIFSHFKDMFQIKRIGLLLILGVLFYVGLGIFQFNFTVFLKDVFQWGPAFVGSLLTIVGVCDIFTRAVALPWLLKRYSEKNIGIFGLTGLAIGLGLIVVSDYTLSIAAIALAVFFIISGEGLFEPIYTGQLSNSVDDTQQGKLQGVNQSIQSLINMFVPLIAAAIYFYNPSGLYAFATLIIFLAIVFYPKLFPTHKTNNQDNIR